MHLSDCLRHNVGGGPGCLEIEAARNAVDVKHFAYKIKRWTGTALKGIGVDGRKGDASASDEFVLEGGTTGNLILVVGEHVDQAVELFPVQATPRGTLTAAERFLRQIIPKA